MKVRTLSAGVVVVRATAEVRRYLLLRAYQHWDFPKGIVGSAEDPLSAARREVEEETGITQLEFRWGYDFYETPPYGAGKVARYYVALTQNPHVVLPISPELGRPEHHEFRWVAYPESKRLLNARLQPVLSWAQAATAEMNGR